MKLIPHVSFGRYKFGDDERSLFGSWKPCHHDESVTFYECEDLSGIEIWVEDGKIDAFKATSSVILEKHELIGASRSDLVLWFGPPEDKDLYSLPHGDFEVWDFDSGVQVWINSTSNLVYEVIVMKNDED